MWESLTLSSRGGFSTRRIFAYVLSAVAAIFVWVLLSTSFVHADSTTATWSGSTINYNNEQFNSDGTVKAGDPTKLPVGDSVYLASDTSHHEDDIIYYDADADPLSATTAHFIEYTVGANNQLTNPHDARVITVDPSGAQAASETTCAITGGLGWIVCPVSDFLATGMDWIFTQLSSFVAVQPATVGDTHGDLYIAWNIMRTIANVAFIIAFLIIIYSQITNIGITNYSIKKLLPRLIVAAILVNVSYYICAAAIDVSNIIGYSIQEIFIGIRQNVFHAPGVTGNSSIYSWQSVTGVTLAGGTLAIGGFIGASAATAGASVGAIYLLLPALVGLLLAIIVVLLILAARQAIIVMLLIVAPLAFVANLLPNTEKWFGEWRKLFMTMLIFFPAFSFVFAGAQLAGAVIISNATSINMIILGLIVQVAPLVITPLLIRLSGDVLGKVVGVVNNPGKGLLDRTRAWSNERAEMHRQNSLSKPGGFNLMRRFAQAGDNDNRRVKERTALYTTRSENRYNATRKRSNLNMLQREADDNKQLIETRTENRYTNGKLTNARLQALDVDLNNAAATLENSKTAAKVQYENLRAPSSSLNTIPRHLASRAVIAQQNIENTGVLARQMKAAQDMQEEAFSRAIKTNIALRTRAGGIDPHGADNALAAAINTLNKAAAENIAAGSAVIADYKFDNAQLTDLSVNGSATNSAGETLSGILFQQAAFEIQLKSQNADAIGKTIRNAASLPQEMRDTIKGMLDANYSSVKATALWAVDDSIKSRILMGLPVDDGEIQRVLGEQFDKDNVSMKTLAQQDPQTLQQLFNGIRSGAISGSAAVKAKELAHRVITSDDGTLTDMKKSAIDITEAISKL